MLKTKLCDLLGVEHPIMLAGMGTVARLSLEKDAHEARRV